MMTGGGAGLRGRERVASFPLLSWRMWYVVWAYTHFCCVHTHMKLHWVSFTPFCPPPLSVFSLPPPVFPTLFLIVFLPSPIPLSPPPPLSLPLPLLFSFCLLSLSSLCLFLSLFSLLLLCLFPSLSLSLSSQALTPTLGSHGTMEILTEMKL